MPPPSGAQVHLTAGDYRATVTEVGASLRELEHRGRPLVRGYGEREAIPVYSGVVLAPWPNRIADGRYRYGGREHQVPVNEADRATALHGLVASASWEVLSRSAGQTVLRTPLSPVPGYPFDLALRMTYRLGADGLTLSLAAENTGAATAPYGCSIHPYLVAGAGRVDDWSLELRAGRYLEVDPTRLLPTGERPVEHTPFDFRDRRQLGSVEIDHAFSGIEFDPAGRARATLLAADGHGVRMTWGSDCRWVQVHTADRPEPALDRTGLALEPMTCPPDAFRSGTGLIHLAPGATHTTRWHLSAV